MPLHAGKGRTVGKAISDIIDYVKNPERPTTAGSSPATSVTAAWLMRSSCWTSRPTPPHRRVRGKDDVIAYHLAAVLCAGEITPEEANRLGVELARRFTGVIAILGVSALAALSGSAGGYWAALC